MRLTRVRLLTVARARRRFMLEFAPFPDPPVHGKHQVRAQARPPGGAAPHPQHEAAHHRAHRHQEHEQGGRRRQQGRRFQGAARFAAPHRSRGRERRHAPQCRRPAQEPPGACPEGHEVTTQAVSPTRIAVESHSLNDRLDAAGVGHAKLYLPGVPQLTSRILVINDEHLVLREFVKGLNAAARALDNPLGISFSGVTTAKEALSVIESDRDLQAVLVDDRLYSLAKNGSNSKKKLQMSALELVQRITRFRPELDVYILIAQEKEDDVVDKLFTESVDGYFYREEPDYRGIYRILNAQIQERARTPFYDQLKNYVWMAKDQWHTPGHSSGESLRGSPWVNDFYEFMGEHVFDADLSVSVPMLDSLMEPKGVIAEAQAMAAKAFGARRTYFATNGTSTANKVILQTLLAPGEKLLLDPNCHKSVHHGVVLSGAHPVYLDSALNRKYGLYGPVPKKILLSSIKKHPDAQALILTSCTYDGLRYDLAPIIDAAHAKGLNGSI